MSRYKVGKLLGFAAAVSLFSLIFSFVLSKSGHNVQFLGVFFFVIALFLLYYASGWVKK